MSVVGEGVCQWGGGRGVSMGWGKGCVCGVREGVCGVREGVCIYMYVCVYA